MSVKCMLLFSSLFVCLIGSSIQQQQQLCADPAYEDFSLNALPVQCQPSCTNAMGVIPCPQASGPGCVCTNGTIRTNNGMCTLTSRCPSPGSPCPTNVMEYKDSMVNPLCQATCDNLAGISPCIYPNVSGCQCLKDNYRNVKSNRCVPRQFCPRKVKAYFTQTASQTTKTPAPTIDADAVFSRMIITLSKKIYNERKRNQQRRHRNSYGYGNRF